MPAAATIDLSDELIWLFDLLGTTSTNVTIDYLGRPGIDDLRLLIPTSPPAVAAAALRRPHDDRGWSERLQAVGGQLLGRLGLLARAPGAPLALPQFELVEHLAHRLGEPELVAAVTIGTRRRNRKPVLQLIRPDGRVVGFAKIGWSPLTHDLVRTEHETLRAIEGRLPTGLIVPSVLTVEHWGSVSVAVTSELRPPLLATGQAPGLTEIVRAIAAAGSHHRSGGGVETTTVAGSATIQEGRGVGLDRAVDLDRVLACHGEVELEMGLWHGDLTPWNIVRRGSVALLWDWEFAGPGRPVGFDALHHTFEHHRRRIGGDNASALAAVMATASQVLAPLDLGLEPEQLRALVDLYLCELMVRELRLSHQRWSGGEVAALGPALASAIEQRLR
jgi:hypothetical protein